MKTSTGVLKSTNYLVVFVILLLAGSFMLPKAHAQYFGRNKPSYRSFDFNVYQSPNFEIYHYFENDSLVHELASTFEKWYVRHRALFLDTLVERNPILIYANHPDFQQTTAVSGAIGIGTQGVTEALKNRVVIPVLETNAQTDHVIGHELVHVFHFRALFKDDSLGLNSLQNLPLWMVEGMAEYFSIGSVDSHTAMILRDAIHQEDFPDLKEMTRNYQYNPYRYGHGFISFFGRTWGDSLIAPLYTTTARIGYERALERVVGLSDKTISQLWKQSYQTHFEPLMADSSRHVPVGRRIVSEENAGHINISPSLSPDGRHLAFFSERDLVSIDLFLADAESGKIKHKLSSSVRNADIDGFNFFESVGTWSPDGKQFVHVAVKKGVSQLVIVDVDRPRRSREMAVPGVNYLNNPSWSPDGQYLAFTGLVEGRPNLYMLEMDSRELIQITNDHYSYIHPSWSPDSRYLTFSTDRPQTAQMDEVTNFHFNLGILDINDPSGAIRVLDVFPGAENLNPLFTPDQDGLYFLSNSDGYRNLFYVELSSESVFRLTDFYTGISGITHLSPALSIARHTGELVYSHYQADKYAIYRANPDEFEKIEVDPQHIDMTAATLPPLEAQTMPLVDAKLGIEPDTPIFPLDSFAEKPYEPKFSLSYIGSSGGVGMSTSRFGTGVSGGVSMMFSDITGDNQMFSALSINGEIYDFGGQIGYLNQKGRISWGGMLSHIPYSYARLQWIRDSVPSGGEMLPIDNLQMLLQRTFEDEINLFAYYPISTTRRIEASGSMAWYYFRIDAYNNFYYQGYPIGYSDALPPKESNLPSPDGFSLQRLGLSYVGDNSYFGMASPIVGKRYRLGLEKYFGRIDMYSLTADYRHYFLMRPFTLAVRGTHYGRYGNEAENDLFYPLYLGYPGFVRGVDYNSLYKLEESFFDEFTFDQLYGSRVLMGGIELRVPLTGPERLALITSNYLFTELNWFFDAGVAWSSGQNITFDPDQIRSSERRFPIFSTGPSLRINLFGALILEPFYAFPFHTKGIQKGVWGLNFLPGW